MHPYSKALFDLLRNSGQQEALAEEVMLLNSLLQENPDFAIMADHPVWSTAQRKEIIEDTLQDFDPLLVMFATILAADRKLREFDEITEGYQALCREDQNIVDALVRSALPLNETDREKVIQALEKRLNKKVQARFETDKNLIAGIQVVADGQILDNSVSGRLNRLGELLKEGQG